MQILLHLAHGIIKQNTKQMKSLLKYCTLICALIFLTSGIQAQTTTKNLAAPYYSQRTESNIGSFFLYNPAIDTMDNTPSDDSIFYYWTGLKIYNQYDLTADVWIDTVAGNLTLNAGTITIQECLCPGTGSGNCDKWQNVDTDNLPAQDALTRLTGTVNGNRLRALFIGTNGNFIPFLRIRLTRE